MKLKSLLLIASTIILGAGDCGGGSSSQTSAEEHSAAVKLKEEAEKAAAAKHREETEKAFRALRAEARKISKELGELTEEKKSDMEARIDALKTQIKDLKKGADAKSKENLIAFRETRRPNQRQVC